MKFHLVPPTYAKKGNIMIQTFLSGFRPESSLSGKKPELDSKAKVFYYLINQKDNNAGNRMWDSYGNLMIIDNESGFSATPSPVYENELNSIKMDEVFDLSSWQTFSKTTKAQWKDLIGKENIPLSKKERRAFISRVKTIKSITQGQIDKGDISWSKSKRDPVNQAALSH